MPPPYSQLSIGRPAQAASMPGAHAPPPQLCSPAHPFPSLSAECRELRLHASRSRSRAAAAPMGVAHLHRSQLRDDWRKRSTKTIVPGSSQGGVFRPRSCVRSAGGGCPRTSPPLGFPGGFQRFRVPSPMFGSSRRGVLRASGALSRPSCLLPTGVSLSGRLSAGAYRVLDPVPISRRRVIV